MRRRLIRAANCILIVALTVAGARFVAKETVTVDAAPTISQVKDNIAGLTTQIEGIDQKIETMEEKQEILEEEMADLNAEIINTMTSIGMKEDEIAAKETEIAAKETEIENKQADIETASENYEEAKQQETKQFEDMVVRLRKMYEGGETGYLNRMLGGNSLGESLNHMDYVEKIYEFDRRMLQAYEAAKEHVMELWNQLEEDKLALEEAKTGLETDKANLEADKANLEAERDNLNTLLDRKKKQSDNYEAEIKKAKQEANVAKAKLQQEQKELKRLLEEEKKKKTSNVVNGTYTTDYNSIINEASGSELGKQIARYACQYIGNPYVSGGTSLTNGADCSGFTYRVYQDFGYSLPRTSYEQRSAGKSVEYSNAQPGDLICYSGHVALYIGGGKIVHASSERTGIKVSNAQYRTILAVRRII